MTEIGIHPWMVREYTFAEIDELLKHLNEKSKPKSRR